MIWCGCAKTKPAKYNVFRTVIFFGNHDRCIRHVHFAQSDVVENIISHPIDEVPLNVAVIRWLDADTYVELCAFFIYKIIINFINSRLNIDILLRHVYVYLSEFFDIRQRSGHIDLGRNNMALKRNNFLRGFFSGIETFPTSSNWGCFQIIKFPNQENPDKIQFESFFIKILQP